MRALAKLTEYKNFWLIWIGCAGKSAGASLFALQREWGITTNYLYHKETGLGKPLVKMMLENGFLSQDKSKFTPLFEWIPSYVLERHPMPQEPTWTANTRMIEKWPVVQKFMSEHRTVLFDQANLKILYRGKLDTLKKFAPSAFDDLYLFVFMSSLVPFYAKYHAAIVGRMLKTLISIHPEKDLIGYFEKIRHTIGPSEIPQIIANEEELLQALHP